MSAFSGCPPTEVSCDPNVPQHIVTLPATPAGLATIVAITAGCTGILLLIAGGSLLITRQSPVPVWKRKIALSAFIFALVSGAVALFTWTNYLPFTHSGLPTDASYSEWLTQVGPVKIGDLDTLLNALTYVTGGIVLVSLLLTVIVVEQAMRRGFQHNTR
ncbi:MAG TPA: hypothetical protein VH591_12060 [Ktedonobacterales bacterium]|jgi:predicted small integral membrane protein